MNDSVESDGRVRRQAIQIAVWIVGIVLLAVALDWALRSSVTIGDGSFDVIVTVLPNDKRIESIQISASYFKEHAEQDLRDLALESPSRPFTGEPITLGIQSVTRGNYQRVISRGWQKDVVAVTRLNGNRVAGGMTEVPDEENTQVRVELDLKRSVIVVPFKGF